MQRWWQRNAASRITRSGRGAALVSWRCWTLGGHMRRIVVLLSLLALWAPASAQRVEISSKPDTPFKLATFEAAGKTRVGLVLGTRVLDIGGANAEVGQKS